MNSHKALTHKKHAGVTLIELMIAMALGIGLTLAVINIVMVTNRSSSLADGLSQSQETGRFALSYMSKAIQMAGYTTGTDEINPFIEICPANNYALGHCTYDKTGGYDYSTPAQPERGDRIALTRQVSVTDNKNCAGQDINTASKPNNITADTIVIDTFWVEEDSSGEPNLYCLTYLDPAVITNAPNSFEKNKQPIANGITAMHVLYGYSEAPDPGKNRNVTRYIAANELPVDPVTNRVDWKRVYSVRLAILTHSYEESSLKKKVRGYVLMDSEPYTYNDSFSRQIFTTTIARKNYQ